MQNFFPQEEGRVAAMNLNNMRNVKMPNAGPAGAFAKLAVIGGIGLYGAMNSLYNVEGGHRAIVFNRLVGVKDKVNLMQFHAILPVLDRARVFDDRLFLAGLSRGHSFYDSLVRPASHLRCSCPT